MDWEKEVLDQTQVNWSKKIKLSWIAVERKKMLYWNRRIGSMEAKIFLDAML